MTPDEKQAADYRAALRRRVRARRAALLALRGDRDAARAVEEGWAALIDGMCDLSEGALEHGERER